MKNKYINLALMGALALSLVGLTSKAAQLTAYVNPGTYTNVLSLLPNNGSLTVKAISVTAPAAGSPVLTFIDSPTNQLTYTNSAYTNRISYATNYITSWTNFYGVAQSTTNIALVTTTNAVSASTNLWPVRFVTAVPTNTTVVFTGVNYYFESGMWVTNSGTGAAGQTAAVIITY